MKAAVIECEIKAIEAILEKIKDRGDNDPILEFGVYEGFSLSKMVSYLNKHNMPNKVYGFDGFVGLPRSEHHWKQGEACSSLENTWEQLTEELEDISRIVLHKGLYEEEFKSSVKEKIDLDKVSLIHIDCDLSDSILHVLKVCRCVMKAGTFIIMHDWLYDKNQAAWNDFIKLYGIRAKTHEIKTRRGNQGIFEIV